VEDDGGAGVLDAAEGLLDAGEFGRAPFSEGESPLDAPDGGAIAALPRLRQFLAQFRDDPGVGGDQLPQPVRLLTRPTELLLGISREEDRAVRVVPVIPAGVHRRRQRGLAVGHELRPRPEDHHHESLANRRQRELAVVEVTIERLAEAFEERDSAAGELLLAGVRHEVMRGLLDGEPRAELLPECGGPLGLRAQRGGDERPPQRIQRPGVLRVDRQRPADERRVLLAQALRLAPRRQVVEGVGVVGRQRRKACLVDLARRRRPLDAVDLGAFQRHDAGRRRDPDGIALLLDGAGERPAIPQMHDVRPHRRAKTPRHRQDEKNPRDPLHAFSPSQTLFRPLPMRISTTALDRCGGRDHAIVGVRSAQPRMGRLEIATGASPWYAGRPTTVEPRRGD